MDHSPRASFVHYSFRFCRVRRRWPCLGSVRNNNNNDDDDDDDDGIFRLGIEFEKQYGESRVGE
jgi:hypothetical protein